MPCDNVLVIVTCEIEQPIVDTILFLGGAACRSVGHLNSNQRNLNSLSEHCFAAEVVPAFKIHFNPCLPLVLRYVLVSFYVFHHNPVLKVSVFIGLLYGVQANFSHSNQVACTFEMKY